VGKAIYAYTQSNGEYFPFAWQKAAAATLKAPVPAADAFPAMTSIGCLYPQYIDTAKSFRCPSVEDKPEFVVSGDRKTMTKYQWSNRTYTLQGAVARTYPAKYAGGTSYGYGCRIYPSAPSGLAMFGDMDGSWQVNKDKSTQNHEGGQNVLYVDGHVSFKETNYASNDLKDNIYTESGTKEVESGVAHATEKGWNADTDAYLRDRDCGLSAIANGSYQSFPDLQR
jgi:prepilin-type processing-associated H-X9-DG protein